MLASKESLAVFATALLLLNTAAATFAQEPPQQPKQPQYRMRVTSELVLVNVIARDRKGNLIRGLKKEDFTVTEDGKRQDISTFDFENVDELATSGLGEATVTGTAANAGLLHSADATPLDARDRRLMLLFFDFSGMDPEQIERGVDSAKKFIREKMKPADMIALVSLSTNMRVDLDFTADKSKVLSILSAYTSSQGQGFDAGAEGSAEGAAETGGSFTPDDTDYNTFTADRKLLALQAIMKALGKINQKKSIIYFSNGITQSGVDNQSALRATTAAAVRANVSIYPLDVRGLQAFPPGGEAQNASLHGQSAYNGNAIFNDLNSNANSQETLATLAEDTGGKAFFDSNDFTGVFSQVQKDTSAYYVLGFTSSNPLKDGHFRHLKVQLNRPDAKEVKLEYRSGYYAGRDFQHLNNSDREQQLDEELEAQLPQTDVAVYAGAHYFRQDDSHYYLGVSLVIPGSQIPFVQAKDKDSATIDIIGEVLANGKLPVGHQRDTVKLAVDSAQQVRRKNVQYNTGFLLAPGSYHLKFVVRENRTGRMGTFETDMQIPDLRKAPLRMSSVVLASQRVPATAKQKKGLHPLVQNQSELVPNITHVFTQDQHLYLQYEVYDAAHAKKGGPAASADATANLPQQKAPREAVRVLTSIEFLQGNAKIYESKEVVASEVTAPDRKAVIFQIDLPLQSLKPGFYTCQVNVVDDNAGNFAFPRWPILVKEPTPPAAPATSTTGAN